MTDTAPLIEFDAGEVLADFDARTITGLLLPHDEVGRTNAGEFAVAAGAIDLPADPLVVTINTDHERSAPVGRAERVWSEPAGIFATFRIANTPEGDAALDAVRDGSRSRLSAEFHATIDAARKLATKGRLWGAALVQRGAFPSAAVLAEESDTTHEVDEYTDADGVTWRRVYDRETTYADDGTTTTTTTETTETITDAADEAEETEDTMPEQTTSAAVNATALHTPTPAGHTAPRNTRAQQVLASYATAHTDPAARREVLASVFGAMADLRNNPGDGAAREVLAAFTNVTTTSLGPADRISQPNWVGLIVQGIGYEREYLPLGTVGTAISLAGKKGYKVKRGTSASPVEHFDGTWGGNKAALGSFQGFSEGVTSTRRQFALGADFAREFYDLPGSAEAAEELMRLVVEDYYVWSDLGALEDWNTAAGALVAFDETKMPTGSYPPALAVLIQGILLQKRRKFDGRRDSADFAIMNEAGFEQLLYAAGGAENLPAFISIAVNTASNGTVDGNVHVVQGDVTDADPAAPAAIVGAKYAIDFDELPGNSPLTIDALHIANGGIDKAVHGYLQTFRRRDEAVQKVGTAPAAG